MWAKALRTSSKDDEDNSAAVNEEELAQLTELRNRVFNQELLLQKILDFAIRTRGRRTEASDLSPSDIKACRLVNKDWLQGVTKCLHKSRDPLFNLQIKEDGLNWNDNLLRNQYIQQLNSFQASLTCHLAGKPPPIKVHIEEKGFFNQRNHQLFTEILSRAGKNLVELEMCLPRDGGSMVFIFQNVALPRLRKLKTNLVDITVRRLEVGGSDHLGNVNLTYLLQAIISAAPNLAAFQIMDRQYRSLIPLGFEYLVLPNTITGLAFSSAVSMQDLGILMRNRLPALKHLDFEVMDPTFESRMISDILHKFRGSLEYFSLSEGAAVAHHGNNSPTLVVPLMEKLEVLDLASANCELGSNNPHLDQKLPKLRKLSLMGQSVTMFGKWVDGRRYDSVVTLEMGLKSDELNAETGIWDSVKFSETLANSVHLAFANLTSFTIGMACTDLSGLRCVFRNLKKLQSLGVTLQGSKQVVDSEQWDCLLSGLSPEDIRKWKENPEDFRNLEERSEIKSSITNLTELRKLRLNSADPRGIAQELRSVPIISDASFELAFLKMPKLTRLTFMGRFMVSPEMVQKWKALGKKVDTYPDIEPDLPDSESEDEEDDENNEEDGWIDNDEVDDEVNNAIENENNDEDGWIDNDEVDNAIENDENNDVE